MNSWISIGTKKSFLEWFLQNYRLRTPEARRIVENILSAPHLLQNLYFTDLVHPNEHNLEIATTCAEGKVPFKYHKGSGPVSFSVAEAHQFILANPKSRIYLLLHFRGKQLNFKYQELVKGPTIEAKEASDMKKWSEWVIKKSLLQGRLTQLSPLIDQALQNGDKDSFNQLTRERRIIEQELSYFLDKG